MTNRTLALVLPFTFGILAGCSTSTTTGSSSGKVGSALGTSSAGDPCGADSECADGLTCSGFSHTCWDKEDPNTCLLSGTVNHNENGEPWVGLKVTVVPTGAQPSPYEPSRQTADTGFFVVDGLNCKASYEPEFSTSDGHVLSEGTFDASSGDELTYDVCQDSGGNPVDCPEQF